MPTASLEPLTLYHISALSDQELSERIKEALSSNHSFVWRGRKVYTMRDLFSWLSIDPVDHGGLDFRRFSRLLRGLGYEGTQRRINGVAHRFWVVPY